MNAVKKNAQEDADQAWMEVLTTGNFSQDHSLLDARRFRAWMKILPSNPRCKLCSVPFSGIGGKFARAALGRGRSMLNPSMCNRCEKYAHEHGGGAEVEISMLFADVRGSTGLAEAMTPHEFSRLIDRFYRAVTDILIDSNAWIEKLIGDEVTGLFIPGFAGKDHARVAVNAARAIMAATGHGSSGQPWIPVGIGVHTGMAYVGAVGEEGSLVEITALGDSVNTAARLSSNAGSGEILVSEQTWKAAGIPWKDIEKRSLQLKGRTEPVDVRVLKSLFS